MFKLLPLVVFVAFSFAQDDKSNENYGITKLDLSGKNLSSLNDYDFSKYTQLKELDLSNNSIDTIRGDKFEKNKLLKKLNLSGNTHLDLPKYATLLDANIEELNLSNCNIQEFPQSILDGLTKLKIIDLSNNPIQSIKPISFTNLLELQKIILPDLKDKEAITEICNKSDKSQITIEVAEESLQCSDVRDGKWVETPNNDSSINLHNNEAQPEAIHKDNEETHDTPEINDEPVDSTGDTDDTKPDMSDTDTPNEQPPNIISDDQEVVEKVVSKTLNSPPSISSDTETKKVEDMPDATDSQSIPTVLATKDVIPKVNKGTAETPDTKSDVASNTSVAIHEIVETPSPTIHRSLPVSEPDHLPNKSVPAISASAIQLPPVLQPPATQVQLNINNVPQTQPKVDNKQAPIPAQQPNESEASTGASSSQGTGTNILIFLVVAVVISGIAAFGYRFYKTRTYRSTNTQEPIERELQEIVTDKKSNGPVLDNVLEEEPLMEKIETNIENKNANDTKENHSHNVNHAKAYIPITSIPLKDDA